MDCANGVGAKAVDSISDYIDEVLPLKSLNTATDSAGALNNQCGADFVKTKQTLPPSVAQLGVLAKHGTRACSFDGDADRIIYYYVEESNKGFKMLDGDKIAVLVALFFKELLTKARLPDDAALEVGVVQTAYANGSSTKYLKSVSGATYNSTRLTGSETFP